MKKFKRTMRYAWSHRTKVLGYGGIIIGTLATSTVMPPKAAAWFLLINSLGTALVGHYNSQKPAPVQEK